MQHLKRHGLCISASVLFGFGLLYVLTGCCYPVDPDDEQPGIENPSFAQHIQPIFTASCALSGCHNAGAAAGLDLSTGMSYAQLVGITSSQDPSRERVDPGDAQASYLVVKIEGRQSEGSRMPLGRSPLSATEIDTIRNWINLGAEDNR
ncbi:hypothetical protein ACFLR7_07260 [Acidobacteriota bacterium]